MPKIRTLRGLAHDTADHAIGPFGYLHPHVGEYAEEEKLQNVVIDLIHEPAISTPNVPRPLRLASAALQDWFKQHLAIYGFGIGDLAAASLTFGSFGSDPSIFAIAATLETTNGRGFTYRRGWPLIRTGMTQVSRVEIVDGDLLDQHVDAIVNPWNRNFLPWWLLLPRGVSGAIKKRGGSAPFRELRRFGMLESGAAVVTTAGNLPFRGIIHVAGLDAFWRSSEAIARACVRNALKLAGAHGYNSVAIPLIGSGTGGLSPEQVQVIITGETNSSRFGGRVVVVRYDRLAST